MFFDLTLLIVIELVNPHMDMTISKFSDYPNKNLYTDVVFGYLEYKHFKSSERRQYALKRIGMTALLIAAMLTGTVQAAVTLSENTDTRIITANGSVDGATSTNLIALNIKNEDDELIYTAFIPTTDGEFEYSFKLPDKSGIYNILFTAHDGAEAPIKYEYLSEADITLILNGINGAAGAGDIVDIMKIHYKMLAISEKWHKLLSSVEQEKIAEEILKQKGAGYTSLQTIRDIVRQKLCIAVIDNAADENTVREAFSDFKDLYSLKNKTKMFEKYQGLSDTEKKHAEKIIAAADIMDFDSLYKVFDEAVFLGVISCAKQPSDITDAIKKYIDIIPFSLDEYHAADEDLMAAALYAKKNMVSMDELKTAIHNAYIEQTSTNSDGTGGKPSGKGGGGGSVINHVTEPEPEKKETEAVKFTDMGNAIWAEPAVLYLAEKGIVSGVGEYEFAPYRTVTREQFALMVIKAFVHEDETAISEFIDMPEGHWAYTAVSTAYQKGIIRGIGEGMFGTGENIKRQDIAVMAASAAVLGGYSLNGGHALEFADFDEVSDYAKESVKLMVSAGIIHGYEDGTFRPLDNATRAEAAQIIYTILQGGK